MSDEWDFYFCHVDDKPASLFIDLGIRDDAPLSGLTEMAWLRLYMREPRDDGLSGKTEYERLTEIEDALSEAISDDPKVAYVGRNTSDGCRDFYFYCCNGHTAESCLSSAMVPYSEYEFETGSRSDEEWSTYFEFLYPSDREYQMILNGRVLANLESHGDKHHIEREVCHWVYFKSSDDRSRFLRTAIEKDYKLVNEHDDGEGDRAYGLTVGRVNAVDFTTINNVVLELFDLAIEYNGDYDGWETSVEAGT